MHGDRQSRLNIVKSSRVHFFDFDGVIADSARIKHQAFLDTIDELLEEFKSSFSNALKSELIGVGRAKVAEWTELVAKQTFTKDRWLETFNSNLEDSQRSIEEIPGVVRYIEHLSRSCKNCIIISSAPKKGILNFLECLSLDSEHFYEIHGIESGSKKEIMTKLMSKLNVLPSDCCFYGDMPTDAKAASDLNVPFVRVKSYPGESYSFSTYTQILEITSFNDFI